MKIPNTMDSTCYCANEIDQRIQLLFLTSVLGSLNCVLRSHKSCNQQPLLRIVQHVAQCIVMMPSACHTSDV
jgi:hypothetical protein